MNYNIEDININKLRKDLIDYFTYSMFMISPAVMMNIHEVENADSRKLINIAIKNNFDLNKYKKFQ